MAKFLDEVIKEMASYGNARPSDGMNMGKVDTVGLRGSNQGDTAIKTYKMNDLLGDETPDSDENYSNDEAPDLKQFFMDYPKPSDEDVIAFVDKHGISMDEMRTQVYALINDLLNTGDDGMEFDGRPDMDDHNDEDPLDFSVSGDTGERPANNEMEQQLYKRRFIKRAR